MDDNTIEIRDDEINVEEIMENIRKNIQKRQAAGELPPNPDSINASPSMNCHAGESDDTNQRDLYSINSNWDIRNTSYSISSHRPSIGKFLVKGRQLVHSEVRRYVDPMIFRQTEFNSSIVRIITRQQELETAFSSFQHESDKKIAELNSKIEFSTEELTTTGSELNSKIELTIKELTTTKNELNTKIESTTEELTTTKSELNTKSESTIKELFTRMDVDINARAWLAHVLEDRVQKELAQNNTPPASVSKEITNYFLFEERFRGSRDSIKQRQLTFLPYFEKCSCVLDIGCGRGEFLEILKDHDIAGIGVDSDPDMVAYCRSRQLEVSHSDAIAYLETLEDKSLDGIFIDQVVEHLEPDYLIRLLALCHRKMKFGYYIVIETVNPLSFVSFVNFYVDMTHKRPIHPETLQYLITAAGFRECEKKFVSPLSDASRLKKITDTSTSDVPERKNVEIYNHNIDMLNSILFGAQDYAVIGKK
jgi:O-antigen chain-terminating methyltransferase